jgi:hypothetical protein
MPGLAAYDIAIVAHEPNSIRHPAYAHFVGAIRSALPYRMLELLEAKGTSRAPLLRTVEDSKIINKRRFTYAVIR